MENLFMGILDLLMPLGAFYNTSYLEINFFALIFLHPFFFTYFEECYQEKKDFFLKSFPAITS